MRVSIFQALFCLVLLTGVSAANFLSVDTRAPRLLGDILVDQAPLSQITLSRLPISYPVPDYGYNDVVGDPAAASFYINSSRDDAARPRTRQEMVDIIQEPCSCAF